MIDSKNLKLVIGTRGSDLALAQTKSVMDLLRKKADNLELVQKVVSTSGDDWSASSPIRTGKDAFTKEIDDALINAEIDLAVHSLKDVSNDDGSKNSKKYIAIELVAFPPRESPFDVLLSKQSGETIDSLPRRARIGTSSIRRKIQLKNYRPDFEVVEMHGNVPSRIRKLRDGANNLNAIVLAEAGLVRLGMETEIDEIISPNVILPAVGQGCLAIAARSNDSGTKRIARLIDDQNTRQCILAERRFSREFGGGCNSPLAALATLNRRIIKLETMVAVTKVELSRDTEGGAIILRHRMTGSADSPNRLGRNLAQKVKKSMG